MVIYLSLLVALVGLVTFAISSNKKVETIGAISYGAGLLAFLFSFPAHARDAFHVVQASNDAARELTDGSRDCETQSPR